jgi:hypothetical protein
MKLKALSELADLAQVRISEVIKKYTKPPTAPRGACFLLDLLLAKADRDTIRGDIEEEFATTVLAKYGDRRARLWFWAETARVIATRNRACRWLLVYGFGHLIDWIFKATSS